MKFKHLIDDIAIDLWSSGNFASIENIRRKCNTVVDLTKLTSNKKILSGVVVVGYNQILSLI